MRQSAPFRETFLLPALRGFLDGSLDWARENDCPERYSIPVDDLAAYLVEWFNLPIAEAKMLAMRELSAGMCVRGWRFALSPWYQNGRRLISAQRLHS